MAKRTHCRRHSSCLCFRQDPTTHHRTRRGLGALPPHHAPPLPPQSGRSASDGASLLVLSRSCGPAPRRRRARGLRDVHPLPPGAHEATIESLAYLIANPVEAMAVRSAKHWPGAQTLRIVAHLIGETRAGGVHVGMHANTRLSPRSISRVQSSPRGVPTDRQPRSDLWSGSLGGQSTAQTSSRLQ